MHPLIQQRLGGLRALCLKHRVHRLALFGSAGADYFDPATSDVDLLVEFQPMSPAEHANHYFELREDLERMLGMSVDLVEPGPIRNPYFRRSLDETRKVIYEAA